MKVVKWGVHGTGTCIGPGILLALQGWAKPCETILYLHPCEAGELDFLAMVTRPVGPLSCCLVWHFMNLKICVQVSLTLSLFDFPSPMCIAREMLSSSSHCLGYSITQSLGDVAKSSFKFWRSSWKHVWSFSSLESFHVRSDPTCCLMIDLPWGASRASLNYSAWVQSSYSISLKMLYGCIAPAFDEGELDALARACCYYTVASARHPRSDPISW